MSCVCSVHMIRDTSGHTCHMSVPLSYNDAVINSYHCMTLTNREPSIFMNVSSGEGMQSVINNVFINKLRDLSCML